MVWPKNTNTFCMLLLKKGCVLVYINIFAFLHILHIECCTQYTTELITMNASSSFSYLPQCFKLLITIHSGTLCGPYNNKNHLSKILFILLIYINQEMKKVKQQKLLLQQKHKKYMIF